MELLGTDKEPFLSIAYGGKQSLNNAIKAVASFANHIEEQLFYEFVTNADDANADVSIFYINKNYLIVLNNGEPFYTDRDGDIRNRKGQLYNFLTKNKSDKVDDPSMIGEHGQGSKLLYPLLASKSSRKDQLVDTIKNGLKGPYLFSWHNDVQLQNLLLLKNNWTFTNPEDETGGMLVAKILYTYYPISPGIDERLFSFEELSNAVNAFDELVQPRRNMNILHRGTALVIPLGEGQYEAITNEDNLEKVYSGIGGFISLANNDKNRSLKHILIFGKGIEPSPAKTMSVDFQLENDNTDYHHTFAFNPTFAGNGQVNLFHQHMPIREAKYGLGFVIDSPQFETDDSRQRVTNLTNTTQQLNVSFQKLFEKIQPLRSSNKDLFTHIYNSLIASQVPEGDDFDFIRTSFYEAIEPFLKKNVQTVNGTYADIENVRYSADDLAWIPLDKIGLSYHWINADIMSKYDYFGIEGINEISYAELLLNANQVNLSKWIKSLDNPTYAKLHKINLTLFDDERIRHLNIFMSNKGYLYSYNDILDPSNSIIVFHDQKIVKYLNACTQLEFISQSMLLDENDDANYWIELMVNKIKSNEDLFAKSTSTQEYACAILSEAYTNKIANYTTIPNIKLLTNRDNKRVSFSELFLTRPVDTSLYDKFTIKGCTPSSIMVEWCANTPLKQWLWTKNNMAALISAVPDWKMYTVKYLKDIKSVYTAQLSGSTIPEKNQIALYLDDEGVPTETVKYRLNNGDKLTATEYEHIRSVFNNENIISPKFASLLNSAPFGLNKLTVSDLHSEEACIDDTTLSAFFKMENGNLLSTQGYHIEKCGNEWKMSKLKPNERNYIGTTATASDIDAKLEEKGFYRIHNELLKHIGSDKLGNYKFTSNDELIKHAISSFSSNSFVLLSIIDDCNIDIKTEYFSKLGEIHINEPIPADSYEWKFINYGIKNASFRQNIFNALRCSGHRLPDVINSDIVVCNSQTYSVYDLDESVKIGNNTIENFLSFIPNRTAFKTAYYADTENQISAELLYTQLCNKGLSVEQMLFCIDYLMENVDVKPSTLTLNSAVATANLLDAIKSRNLIGFNQYYTIPNFDISKHIFADDKYLNSDEFPPLSLREWCKLNPDGVSLFDGAITESDSRIQIRRAFLDARPYSGTYDIGLDHQLSTLTWITDQNKEIVDGSEQYKIVQSILERPQKFEGKKYLLRYIKCNEINGKISAVYKLSELNSDYYFVYSREGSDFSKQLAKSQRLQQLIQGKYVYQCDNSKIARKLNLNNDRRWEITTNTKEDGAFTEWNNITYKEWVRKDKIRILLSTNDIAINFAITCDGKEVFSESIKNADIGYSANSFIVIKYPNPSNLSVLKTIEQHLKDSGKEHSLGWFQKPFIELQGMFLDQLENIEHIAQERGFEVSDFIKSYSPASTNEEDNILSSLSSDHKKLLAENIDNIVTLCNALTKEELEDITKNIDLIRKRLLDEKEEESAVRKIIGYIGELIFEQYLRDHLNVSYEFSADNRVGEYDFKYNVNDRWVYVDVKTNLYSLKDGNAPFYIHKTQNAFMRSHPNAEYHIVRISLKDLALEEDYYKLRDYKDQDPRTNMELKSKCQSIAKKYWLHAQKEEFVNNSPEYAIRIERFDY